MLRWRVDRDKRRHCQLDGRDQVASAHRQLAVVGGYRLLRGAQPAEVGTALGSDDVLVETKGQQIGGGRDEEEEHNPQGKHQLQGPAAGQAHARDTITRLILPRHVAPSFECYRGGTSQHRVTGGSVSV